MLKPYKPKSKQDELKRKQAYQDSTLMNKGVWIGAHNRKHRDENEAGNLQMARAMPASDRTLNIKPTGIRYEDTPNMPGSESTYATAPAPRQKVLDYVPPAKPGIPKLKSRNVALQTDGELPSTLDTIAVPEFKGSNQKINRQVAGVQRVASTKRGYENLPEYGKFKKKDSIDVPKSAVRSTYAEGTRGINIDTMKEPFKMKSKKKLQKAARGLNDVAVPEAGDMGNVLSSGLSMGAAGAEIGGPWGAAIGGLAGVGMGLLQKGEQDRAAIRAKKKNILAKQARAYDGVDETINQSVQTFKKGTNRMKAKKLIEVEGKEHHFDENLNHKGVYQGPSHAKGGIDTVVEEGDVIIPKKHKTTVDKALKVGDFKKIEKIRKTLPKDTPNGTAALGLDNDPFLKKDKPIQRLPSKYDGKVYNANEANRDGAFGEFAKAEASLAAGDGNARVLATDPLNNYDGQVLEYTGKGKKKASYYKYKQDNTLIAGKDSLATTNTALPDKLSTITPGAYDYSKDLKTTGSAVKDAETEGSGPGNLLKYANVANNMIRGLQTPKSPEESYLDPELLKYQDRSETLRKASRQAGIIVGNGNSGGNIANKRANQAAASVANLDRQEGINETEMQRADAVDQTNVGIKNNAKQVNLGRKDAYQEQMMQNRAAQEGYQNAGIKGIADHAAINEQMNYQKSRDRKLDELELKRLNAVNQVTKYAGDADGNTNFKGGSGGSLNPGGNTSTSSTIKVGENGKTSTSTTTKQAAVKALLMKRKGGIKYKK